MTQQPPRSPQWRMGGAAPDFPSPAARPESYAPQGQFSPYDSQPTQQWAYAGPPAPQPAPKPKRMPKAQALAVTKQLKAAIIAGSVVAFGVVTALVAGNATGVTSRQSSGTSGASNSNPSNTANPSNNDNPGGFFGQGSNGDDGNSGGFGVSPVAPSQQPFSGSSVS